MTADFASLLSSIQYQLLDDGTLFSTETISAAITQALREFNQLAPINGAEIVAVDSSLQSYELTGGAFPTLVLDITDVLKNDDDGEEDEPLLFDKIYEDNRKWIRLRTIETDGNLLIRFTQPHTVADLDDEVESTMNTDQSQILIDGSCAFAINIRLMKPIEAINLNRADLIVQAYERAATRYRNSFIAGISRYANRLPPVSEKNKTAWTY